MTPSEKHALIINEYGRVAMECRLTLAFPMEHIPAQHQCCTNAAREVYFSREEEETLAVGKHLWWEKVPHKKCTGFPCLCRRVRRETIIYRKMGKKIFYLVHKNGSALRAGSFCCFSLVFHSSYFSASSWQERKTFWNIKRDEIAFVVSWHHNRTQSNATSVGVRRKGATRSNKPWRKVFANF